MNASYELWDTEDSNLVGVYDSRRAALRIVRDSAAAHGRGSMATVALGRETKSGELEPISQGDELIDMAMNELVFDRATAGPNAIRDESGNTKKQRGVA